MSVYALLQDVKTVQNQARSWKFYVLILISLLLLIPVVLICVNLIVRKEKHSDNFEFFLFTSLYPITSCVKYKEESPQKQCYFAPNKEAWSIHGIWPSNRGTMGPSYCKYEKFDPNELQSIRNELDVHWPSVQSRNSETFWKHEWLKHGSCAEQISEFDTEFKYFSQGLALYEQYNVNDMLAAAQIVPNNSRTYKVEEFQAAVQKSIGCRAVIYCELDKAKNVYLISEIRLCFDKGVKLISCDNLEQEDECIVDDVVYPDSSFFITSS